MSFKRCPGSSSFAQPKIEVVPCPDCGADVEIWSDEATGQCPSCSRAVIRTATQSCVDWCRYARECLGDEKFRQYGEMKANLRKAALLNAVQDRLESDPGRMAKTRKTVAYAEQLLSENAEADPAVVMAAAALHGLVTAPGAGSPEVTVSDILGALEYPQGLINEVCNLLGGSGAPPKGPESLHGRLLQEAVRRAARR